MNVYLDDIRKCPDNFILARTKDECINLIKNNKINIISLDHDLGESMETGYDVAKFIVEYGFENNIWPNEIYFHTDNPVGRKNMFQLLNHYCPESTKVHR